MIGRPGVTGIESAMATQPTLTTARLVLRPFSAGDGPRLVELLADREIAENTLTIPYPYVLSDAEAWLGTLVPKFNEGKHVTFALTRLEGGVLIGCVGLGIHREHARAELGYWIGREHRGMGLATEACAAIVRYGFEALALERIFASHYLRNPTSGRVLAKVGMTYEGVARRSTMKWGTFEDTAVYAIVRGDPLPPAPG